MLVGHLVWFPFTFTKHTCQGNFHVSCLSTPWPEEWLDSLSAKTLECCGQPVLPSAGTVTTLISVAELQKRWYPAGSTKNQVTELYVLP